MTLPPSLNRSMTSLEWTMLLSLSLLWGGSFFFVSVAVTALPPFTIVVLRVGSAALALHLLLRILRQNLPRDIRVWQAFFIMGLVNNALPFSLLVWGQTQIAGGVASILNASTPLFTVIVAHLLTDDERMSAGRLFGVLAGLAGVGAMIGPEALRSLGGDFLAQLACIGAAISYAFAGVFGRRFRRLGVSPLASATGQVTASSLILLPVMLLVDRPWSLALPGLPVVLAILGLGLLSTALAYILYFRILATAGATNLLLVTLLVPVSAILLGVFLLGEPIHPKHFVGLAMIGLGLAAIDGRPWALLRSLGRAGN